MSKLSRHLSSWIWDLWESRRWLQGRAQLPVYRRERRSKVSRSCFKGKGSTLHRCQIQLGIEKSLQQQHGYECVHQLTVKLPDLLIVLLHFLFNSRILRSPVQWYADAHYSKHFAIKHADKNFCFTPWVLDAGLSNKHFIEFSAWWNDLRNFSFFIWSHHRSIIWARFNVKFPIRDLRIAISFAVSEENCRHFAEPNEFCLQSANFRIFNLMLWFVDGAKTI